MYIKMKGYVEKFTNACANDSGGATNCKCCDQQWVGGDNGSVTCNQYCAGIGGRPWNNELPIVWNGAICVGTNDPQVGCNDNWSNKAVQCKCEKYQRGWANEAIGTNTNKSVFVLGPYNMNPWNAWNFEDRQAQWIWNDPNAASDTGNDCINFITTFYANTDINATVSIIVDNWATLFINGKQLGGAGGGWGGGDYTKMIVKLQAGQNIISVKAQNGGGPAGLLLSARNNENNTVLFRSDQSWVFGDCNAYKSI